MSDDAVMALLQCMILQQADAAQPLNDGSYGVVSRHNYASGTYTPCNGG